MRWLDKHLNNELVNDYDGQIVVVDDNWVSCELIVDWFNVTSSLCEWDKRFFFVSNFFLSFHVSFLNPFFQYIPCMGMENSREWVQKDHEGNNTFCYPVGRNFFLKHLLKSIQKEKILLPLLPTFSLRVFCVYNLTNFQVYSECVFSLWRRLEKLGHD